MSQYVRVTLKELSSEKIIESETSMYGYFNLLKNKDVEVLDHEIIKLEDETDIGGLR